MQKRENVEGEEVDTGNASYEIHINITLGSGPGEVVSIYFMLASGDW
jgi:hypothetical protein